MLQRRMSETGGPSKPKTSYGHQGNPGRDGKLGGDQDPGDVTGGHRGETLAILSPWLGQGRAALSTRWLATLIAQQDVMPGSPRRSIL